jgi:hypothetical protein
MFKGMAPSTLLETVVGQHKIGVTSVNAPMGLHPSK